MSQPTQIQHCRGCSCQAAINLAQDTQQLVDLVKTANHATSAIAEALRVQSHALLAVVERDNLKPQPATLAPAPPNTNPYGGILMVISERVGSISVEQWNGMSDGDLEDLDRVLKKTVNRSHLGTWMESGVRIQAELAAVGLVFKTVDECLPLNTSRDWKVAENTALGELVRMRAVASASRGEDKTKWWVDEMVRIVVRLMELRGM